MTIGINSDIRKFQFMMSQGKTTPIFLKFLFKYAMRYYHPGEFEKLMTDHGFRIVDRFGGYEGVTCEEGPGLVR